jgi:hypothetical protein
MEKEAGHNHAHDRSPQPSGGKKRRSRRRNAAAVARVAGGSRSIYFHVLRENRTLSTYGGGLGFFSRNT